MPENVGAFSRFKRRMKIGLGKGVRLPRPSRGNCRLISRDRTARSPVLL